LTPNPFIIIVAGTPGTGKTAFSSLLADTLSCNHVNTSRLAQSLGIASPDPSGRNTYYLDNAAIDKLVDALLVLAREGCLIVETVYPEELLEREELNLQTPLVVLLRTRPEVLCERLRSRPWPRDKIMENCLAEAFGEIAVALKPYEDMVIEIDTTRVQPGEALERLLDKLEKWETGLRIDWISDPEIAEYAVRLASALDFDKYRLGL